MQCVADCHSKHPKLFEQPVMQTLQMFIGEAGCWLVVLSAMLYQRVRAKVAARRDGAYQAIASEESGQHIDDDVESDDEIQGMSTSQTLVDPSNIQAKSLIDGEQSSKVREPLTGIKILLLACPAICDILGTTLMNVGLLFVAASIYQMLRGTLILFVGLFSVLFLKHHLGGLKWTSLFIVVLGVAIVGLAGALGSKTEIHEGDSYLNVLHSATLALRSEITAEEIHTAGQTILGLFLIAAAQIFTATQFVLEESIMEHYSMDPIQVVGWEGVFGFAVTLIGMGILHLAIGQTARGRGGYFDAREGFYQLFHHRAIGISSILIMISIGYVCSSVGCARNTNSPQWLQFLRPQRDSHCLGDITQHDRHVPNTFHLDREPWPGLGNLQMAPGAWLCPLGLWHLPVQRDRPAAHPRLSPTPRTWPHRPRRRRRKLIRPRVAAAGRRFKIHVREGTPSAASRPGRRLQAPRSDSSSDDRFRLLSYQPNPLLQGTCQH